MWPAPIQDGVATLRGRPYHAFVPNPPSRGHIRIVAESVLSASSARSSTSVCEDPHHGPLRSITTTSWPGVTSEIFCASASGEIYTFASCSTVALAAGRTPQLCPLQTLCRSGL